MNTWAGKFLGWLSLAVIFSFGTLVPHNAYAAADPVITSQPTSQSAAPGVNVGFSVTATGNSLVYQWMFKGTNLTNNGHILSPYSPMMIVMNISASDVGNYQVIITNSHGSVTSAVATLTVLLPPAITNQPVAQAVLLNSNAIFTAQASGTAPLSYQWQKDGVNLLNGGAVSGATAATLNLSGVQTNDAGLYQVIVTNSYGSATSAVAALTVLVPANITAQPASQVVVLSSNVTFSAAADGTAPLIYQWYFNGTPLSNGGRVSGSTTANLTISSSLTNDAGSYQLVVTNNYGSSTSSMAALTVLIPAMITSQPTNLSVLLASNATFSAYVIGDAPLSFQWYFKGAPLSDDGHVSGSTSTTLAISNIQTNDAGAYQLVATNNYGTVTSAAATLTVLIPAYIISQPTNRNTLSGSNITFSGTASGTAPLGYLWYFNGTTLPVGGPFSGMTTATLSISSALTNYNGAYQVVVTNNYGSVTSSVAILTVYVPVQITGQPASQAVLLGSNASFSVTTGGSVTGFQWHFNGVPLADGGRISGSTTPTLSIANVQAGDAGGYLAVVTNLLSAATSRTASLTPLANLAPSLRYVSVSNATPLSPFLSWNTAATNIQDAIDAAVASDTILVTNGIYNTGSRIVYGATNRVAIDKAVTLQSVNGSASTLIFGNLRVPSIRCVYLTNGASLIGFTLTNGGTDITGDVVKVQSGAGVWSESSSATISNCVILGNTAGRMGGGAFQGTLFDCVLAANIAPQAGGGAASNILINCTLTRNSSTWANGNFGGGAYGCTLSNCLIVANQAQSLIGLGGGAAFSTLISCVVSNNGAGGNGGGISGCTVYSSLISSNAANSSAGAYRSQIYDSTLTRNATGNSGAGSGAGASQCLLSNCVVTANIAAYLANGGGTAQGTNYYCIISGNTAFSGGGTYLSTNINCVLRGNTTGGSANGNYGGGSMNSGNFNCLIVSNSANYYGGGVYGGVHYNCTIVNNIATNALNGAGGGAYACLLNNCIIYFNAANKGSNCSSTTLNYCCTIPDGLITNNPNFVNPASGDFRLASNSPCINHGKNSYVFGSTDLEGNPRIAGSYPIVDIGAYEYHGSAADEFHGWLQRYGLPTDGSADQLDSDGDGMSNWDEWKADTNPTNSASLLKILSSSARSSGFEVSWQTSYRTYYLQRSTNLAAQPAFSTIISNIANIDPGLIWQSDTSATNSGSYFYRVGVQ